MADNIIDIFAEDFQTAAESALVRNKNILDCASKLSSSAARLSRAIIKASTQCGCITVDATKRTPQTSGITGELCPRCRAAVEKEMGDALFYIAGICGALDMSIFDVMLKEKQTIGLFKNYSLM